jgi:glutamate-5-semialdehyde dehydrogenase
MSLLAYMMELGRKAREAFLEMSMLSGNDRNRILLAMADALDAGGEYVLGENKLDVDAASEKGLSEAMIDRLTLNDLRLKHISEGVRAIAQLPDPVGRELQQWSRPNGLVFRKVSVPIGVIGIIYESRPNVTVDAAALCLKSSNAVILRGGSESIRTNTILSDILTKAGRDNGMPESAIQYINTTDRDAVKLLVQMDEYVHMIIPRGGEALIRAVADNARVPVLKHYKGICHIYVDASADMQQAADIIFNAKCQRPGVCNAVETVLIHTDIAEVFLPMLSDRLESAGVELRLDDRASTILPGRKPATASDWDTEYLDLILSIAVVSDTVEAIVHINNHGSGHSDAILTSDTQSADLFQLRVDSATVYVNASTRFTDGFEFGFGAEIGISTDRLHARGPAGLEALTTYKYLINGDGQIRS